MATCKFHVQDWRDIMRICGSITATCPKNHRKECEYILFHVDGGMCTAYGSNGFQCSKVTVDCMYSGLASPSFMIRPIKAPAHTRMVEIHFSDVGPTCDIFFVDEDSDILDAVGCELGTCDPIDFEQFFQKAHDNFGRDNYGAGKYSIAVNPEYLMTALDGLKSCDSVVLNFGSPVEPFTIRPLDDSIKAEAFVLQVRHL